MYGLKTINDISAGDETGKIRIAIYQGDKDSEGKTAALYEYVSDIVVTGAEICSYIPAGSLVNVRIDVDRSEMMTVECEFPATGQKIAKRLDTSKRQGSKSEEYLKNLIGRTSAKLRTLIYELGEDPELSELRGRLRMVERSLATGVQRKQVEQHLKEVMRRLEDYEFDSEWNRTANALKKSLLSLQIAGAKRSSDIGVTRMVESFTAQTQRVLAIQDERKAKFLQHQIEEYEWAITKEEIYRASIRWAYRDFSTIKWTDPVKAQQLVMEAMAILQENPEAPLSAIKDVTEAFNALIERSAVNSFSTPFDSFDITKKNDFLSM